MKRTALAPILAVSLVVGLSAGLSARAAPPGETVVVPSGRGHEDRATGTGGSAPARHAGDDFAAEPRDSPDA